jgi:hypothetical protein
MQTYEYTPPLVCICMHEQVGGDPLPGFIPTFKAPARRQAAYNSLAHYDTWVPNADAASSFYPVAHTHVENAGMGTNNAFLGSSDGAHTGWSTARGTHKN